MSAFANMTLNNNAAVAVVFNPQSIDSNQVATYMVSADGILDAKRRASISVTLPKNGSVVSRVKGKIVVPVMDTVETTKKIGEVIVNIDAAIPKVASETQRLDALAFAKNLLGHANMTAAFQNLEAIY